MRFEDYVYEQYSVFIEGKNIWRKSIFNLMASILIIYHWPMGPIKVKY
jgi:hypothetical protein